MNHDLHMSQRRLYSVKELIPQHKQILWGHDQQKRWLTRKIKDVGQTAYTAQTTPYLASNHLQQAAESEISASGRNRDHSMPANMPGRRLHCIASSITCQEGV